MCGFTAWYRVGVGLYIVVAFQAQQFLTKGDGPIVLVLTRAQVTFGLQQPLLLPVCVVGLQLALLTEEEK